MTSAKGVPIQNDGKQDVFQQLQGWIHAFFESEYPWRVRRSTFPKSVVLQIVTSHLVRQLLSCTFISLTEVMIGLLLNGLGVVKRSQDGEVNDRPRRQAWMPAENEFNDRLIMTLHETMWKCSVSKQWFSGF